MSTNPKHNSLRVAEIKAFVPAKDYEVSKNFYRTLGFEECSDFGDVAYFRHENCSFLLQDFYKQELAENFMMHLLVDDARAWFEHVTHLDLTGFTGVKVSELTEQPWGMLDFCLWDPSGVLWRIAQNLPKPS